MARITELLENLVYSPLGVPALPTELGIQENDIQAALIRYYSYVPLKSTMTYTFISNREVAQNVEQLSPDYSVNNTPLAITAASWDNGVVSFTVNNAYTVGRTVVIEGVNPEAYNGTYKIISANSAGFTAVKVNNPDVYASGGTAVLESDYYYIGVVAFAVRLQTTSPRLNEYLLGTTYIFPNAEPLKQSLLNTQMGENIGDPYYEEDFINNRVNWVVGGSCTLSVTYGFGHNNIEKIPRRHVQLMAFLIGEIYYDRLLSVRKTGKFTNSDFDIDTSVLEEASKNSKSRGLEILESISLVPVTIG